MSLQLNISYLKIILVSINRVQKSDWLKPGVQRFFNPCALKCS